MQEVNKLESFQKLSKRERINAYFPERELDKIKICDNKEKIIDLEEFFSKENISAVFASVWKNALLPRLRESAAFRLTQVAKSLYPHYLLKITDSFRPISFQRLQFEMARKEILSKNPFLINNPEKLYYEVTKYSADPDNCPPHSTGGALDLTLVNPKGDEIDMGTSMDTISELSQTFNEKIKGKAKENRIFLFNAMTKGGFVNLSTEWWHYSYGDQYWAAFLKKPYAIYGKIEEVL